MDYVGLCKGPITRSLISLIFLYSELFSHRLPQYCISLYSCRVELKDYASISKKLGFLTLDNIMLSVGWQNIFF